MYRHRHKDLWTFGWMDTQYNGKTYITDDEVTPNKFVHAQTDTDGE